MPVTFDRKWFNPLYFILNELFKDNSIRTILVYGGKSSSKTISIAQMIVKECFIRGANTMAFRKTSNAIPGTLKKSFTKSIDGMYLHPVYEKQDRRYLCQNQGRFISEIVLKGLDDEEKAKGIESYKYVYLDELNQFLASEFEQINLSLRGIEGQKILGSWNPVDENSWVKLELVDKFEWIETNHKLPCPNSFVKKSVCGKVVLIKTTYEDNFWITGSKGKKYTVNGVETIVTEDYGYRDENIIYQYEEITRKSNAQSYKVNVLGEWGKTVFGGEFLKAWRSEVHTGSYPYNPELAIYLYFDENVNPYLPCGIFQISKDLKTLYLIHVLAKKNPENTVKHICSDINSYLRRMNHKESVYVGGDPTSQKEDVKQEKGYDMFKIIMSFLVDWKPKRATLSGSPSVKTSKEFVNDILEFNQLGITICVDKNCRTAIIDFENTKEDKNGKVDKSTVTDPVSKVSYQPYGHFCDILRYMVCFMFSKEYAEYQRGGKESPMSLGVRKSKSGY